MPYLVTAFSQSCEWDGALGPSSAGDWHRPGPLLVGKEERGPPFGIQQETRQTNISAFTEQTLPLGETRKVNQRGMCWMVANDAEEK